jgi:BON domain-containing protein
MIELPFGSVSSMWSSAPLFGWGQGPPALNRPAGFTPQPGIPNVGGMSLRTPQQLAQPPVPDPYTIATGLQVGTPSFGVGMPFMSNSMAFGGYPTLLPAPPITAFLAAVAMRRGQPAGPTNDQEIEDFVYDVLEFLPGTNDVEVRCEGGRATLTGAVQHKRLKHDVGEIVWAIPGINDVQNTIAITTKRRARSGSRESEAQTPRTEASVRKSG